MRPTVYNLHIYLLHNSRNGYKLQKYIKNDYNHHLKPFLNVNVKNDYRSDLNKVDLFWITVQSFDTFWWFLLISVIFQGNRLDGMYRGDNFVAEKPIIDNHEKSIEFIFVPVCRHVGICSKT
jgi:hypothetical protein